MNFNLPEFNFTLPKSTVIVLSSLLVAVILFFTIHTAIRNGRANAQSQIVYNNAVAATASLDFFYSDQNRYPTAEEFADPSIMGRYMTVSPLAELPSNVCPQSYVYKRLSPRSYQLSFCLPRAYNGRLAGFSQIAGSR